MPARLSWRREPLDWSGGFLLHWQDADCAGSSAHAEGWQAVSSANTGGDRSPPSLIRLDHDTGVANDSSRDPGAQPKQARGSPPPEIERGWDTRSTCNLHKHSKMGGELRGTVLAVIKNTKTVLEQKIEEVALNVGYPVPDPWN
ncbi:hypothetical protein NDU88_011326 [Pleurodeles waltl]|uniref:Uncharacterized protein n=1 Tax=Pleurodeles waltl TaxID=8319 RepID=A0AAV7QWX3_PLEWA|nr:hypothetical protein NDU88_011326 [Pleurodeles waltl]